MLEAIPQAVWPALCSHIHAGVQQGSIDAAALWQLCRLSRRGAQAGWPGADRLQAWAAACPALPPLQTTQVTFVPPGLSASLSPNDDAGLPDRPKEPWQLPLPWQNEPPLAPQTAVLGVPCGMPDIVAFAVALVARAETVGTLPAMRVHPGLTDASCEALGKSRGRAILGLLAEMGLAGRPWHLWLGPKTPQARLSPYVRDLGEALRRWGGAHGLVAPSDGPGPSAGAERDPIELDSLAEAFVASHEGLAAERSTAERSVGITQARIDGLDVAVLDLSRAVPELWDARLPRTNPCAEGDRAQAPLVVQIDTVDDNTDERTHAAMISRLCLALGATLRSVDICKDGLLMRESVQALQASSMLDISCDRCLPCDSTAQNAAFGVDALPYALSAVSDVQNRAFTAAEEPWPAAACIAGGGTLWSRLLRLKHRGVVQTSAPLRLHVLQRHSPQSADALAMQMLRLWLAPATAPTIDTPGAARGQQSGMTKGRRLRV